MSTAIDAPVVGKPGIELTEAAIDDPNVAALSVIPFAISFRLAPLIVASTATEPALKVTLTALAATPQQLPAARVEAMLSSMAFLCWSLAEW